MHKGTYSQRRTSRKMEKKSRNNTRPREGRSHASRLTINIPKGTLTALKIHVARRETTIREIVTNLIQKEISKEGATA